MPENENNVDVEVQEEKKNKEIKRDYKDRLFKLVFGREEYKAATLDLYNAITGSSFTEEDDIVINTIEEAVFLSMHNDVSFLLGDTLNLYEHQSTYSPNFPMRMLLYVSQLYSKMIETDSNKKGRMYTHSRVMFPTPKFYVFYNGKEIKAEERILEITDSFLDQENSDLKLSVRMININYGNNRELMERCTCLCDYSKFVHDVAEYKGEGIGAQEAVTNAIGLLPEGLVKSILNAHKAEATEMFLTEYDEDVVHEAFYNVGLEEGIAKGKAAGIAEGRAETARAMLAEGLSEDIVSKCTSLPVEEVRKLK